MRGYDPVEIDTFIELVANEYESILQENENLQKQIVAAETELKHFKEAEKTLKQTLFNVQETSQLSKENSQKEASLIKKEAELEAAELTEKARLEVHKMKEEVVSLKQQKDSFIARLRHLLSSQMELLELLSLDDEDIAELKDRTKKSFTANKSKEPEMQIEMPVKEEPKKEEKKNIQKSNIPNEQKSRPEPKPETSSNNDDKKRGRDFFKDIFTDNLDVDEI